MLVTQLNYFLYKSSLKFLIKTNLVCEDQIWLNVVLSLTGLAVGLTLVEPGVTLAEVGAFRVDALLRAHASDLVTLVSVLASLLVGHQFVT